MGPFGENLAAGSGNFSISDAVGSWANEACTLLTCIYGASEPENLPGSSIRSQQPTTIPFHPNGLEKHYPTWLRPCILL